MLLYLFRFCTLVSKNAGLIKLEKTNYSLNPEHVTS